MMDDEGQEKGGGVRERTAGLEPQFPLESLSGSCNRGDGRNLQFSSGNVLSHFRCITNGKVQWKLLDLRDCLVDEGETQLLEQRATSLGHMQICLSLPFQFCHFLTVLIRTPLLHSDQ